MRNKMWAYIAWSFVILIAGPVISLAVIAIAPGASAKTPSKGIVTRTKIAMDANKAGLVEKAGSGRIVPIRILGEKDDTWAVVPPSCTSAMLDLAHLALKVDIVEMKVDGKNDRLITAICPEPETQE